MEDYHDLRETTYNIANYFDSHHINSLRKGINKLFRLASDGEKWIDEKDELTLAELMPVLGGFIEDGYKTLNKLHKYGYKHYNCNCLLKEPIILGGNCVEWENKDYLRLIKAFQGEVIYLNQSEVSDFYLPLNDFFLFDDRKNWEKTIQKWKRHAEKGKSLYNKDFYRPKRHVKSLFLLNKFIETCRIINRNYNSSSGIDAHRLYESNQMPFYIDPYGTINPFEEFNKFFAVENSTALKSKLSRWINSATTPGVIWSDAEPSVLIQFHDKVQMILETCWMLYDSYYLLENWFDPECFSIIHQPVQEPSGNFVPDHTDLTQIQIDNPIQFIEESLCESDITFERKILRTLLICALSKDQSTKEVEWIENKLCKMIDALYLLNVSVFKLSEVKKATVTQSIQTDQI